MSAISYALAKKTQFRRAAKRKYKKTAFLNSLRANLALATSLDPLYSSPASSTAHLPISASPPFESLPSTPNSFHPSNLPPITSASPTETCLLPPPEPSSFSTTTNNNDLLSPITTTQALDPETQTTALDLISDSVAQQRQVASNAVIFNPITLVLYIAIVAIIHRTFYRGRTGDLAIVLTAVAGVTVAGLLTVRWMVDGYLAEAETVRTWSWLRDGDGYDDYNHNKTAVLITKSGDEVIAALVISGVADANSSLKSSSGGGNGGAGKKGHRSNHIGGGGGGGAGASGTAKTKAVIRAWTVRQKYRRQGVGPALLEEAAKLCRDKGWSGPVFAHDHAHSARVLPALFNAGFEARESRARDMLERVVSMSVNGNANGSAHGHGHGHVGKGGKGRR